MGLDLLLGLYFSLGVDLSLGACERASMRACECRGCGRAGGAGGRAGVRAGVSSLTRPWLDFLLKKCATGFLRLSDSLSLTFIIFHVRIYRWLACKLYVVAQRSHSLQKSTLNRFSNPGAWVGKLANGPKATLNRFFDLLGEIFCGRSSGGETTTRNSPGKTTNIRLHVLNVQPNFLSFWTILRLSPTHISD